MNSVCSGQGGQRLGTWEYGKDGSDRRRWCACCMAWRGVASHGMGMYVYVSLRHYFSRAVSFAALFLANEAATEGRLGTYLTVLAIAERVESIS